MRHDVCEGHGANIGYLMSTDKNKARSGFPVCFRDQSIFVRD